MKCLYHITRVSTSHQQHVTPAGGVGSGALAGAAHSLAATPRRAGVCRCTGAEQRSTAQRFVLKRGRSAVARRPSLTFPLFCTAGWAVMCTLRKNDTGFAEPTPVIRKDRDCCRIHRRRRVKTSQEGGATNYALLETGRRYTSCYPGRRCAEGSYAGLFYFI